MEYRCRLHHQTYRPMMDPKSSVTPPSECPRCKEDWKAALLAAGSPLDVSYLNGLHDLSRRQRGAQVPAQTPADREYWSEDGRFRFVPGVGSYELSVPWDLSTQTFIGMPAQPAATTPGLDIVVEEPAPDWDDNRKMWSRNQPPGYPASRLNRHAKKPDEIIGGKRTVMQSNNLRDKLWCRALIDTLSIKDIEAVTTRFNQLRIEENAQ